LRKGCWDKDKVNISVGRRKVKRRGWTRYNFCKDVGQSLVDVPVLQLLPKLALKLYGVEHDGLHLGEECLNRAPPMTTQLKAEKVACTLISAIVKTGLERSSNFLLI